MRRAGVVIIFGVLMLLGGVSCEWYAPWTWFSKSEEPKVEDPIDTLLNYNKADWTAKIEGAEKNIGNFPQISEDFLSQVKTCQSSQELILNSVTEILNKAVYNIEMPNNEPFVTYFEVKAAPKPDPEDNQSDPDAAVSSSEERGSKSGSSDSESNRSETSSGDDSGSSSEANRSQDASNGQGSTPSEPSTSGHRHHRLLTHSGDLSKPNNQILALEKILHRIKIRHREERVNQPGSLAAGDGSKGQDASTGYTHVDPKEVVIPRKCATRQN
jgi:hypothetical protein